MDKRKIALRLRFNGCSYVSKDYLVDLCADGLRRYIYLPGEPRHIDIVFQDRPRADSFTIRATHASNSFNPARVKGVRAYILSTTCSVLREQYNAGRRYFHFEY